MAASLLLLIGRPLWGPVEASVPAASGHEACSWGCKRLQAGSVLELVAWDLLTSGPHLPSQADTWGRRTEVCLRNWSWELRAQLSLFPDLALFSGEGGPHSPSPPMMM